MIQRLNIKAVYKIALTALLLGAAQVQGQETLCVGSIRHFAVDLTENDGNGSTGSAYTWQVTAGIFSGTITPLTASGNRVEIDWGTSSTGAYLLTVTESQNGCQNTQTIEILLRDEVQLNELEDLLICPEDGSVTFNAGFGYDSYAWYNETGEMLANTRLLTVESPGTYILEVTQNGCTATQAVEATPLDFPVFVVNTENYNTILVEHIGGNVEELEYQLEDLEGNVIKSWQVGNTFYGINEGIYIVRIRSWDATCYTYITATTISVPNTITPNGDGYNDTWDLSRLQNIDPDAKIEVFDRYGKLLKRITSAGQFRWDGKYNGNPLPSASYIYIMYLGDQKITGHLLIKN